MKMKKKNMHVKKDGKKEKKKDNHNELIMGMVQALALKYDSVQVELLQNLFNLHN